MLWYKEFSSTLLELKLVPCKEEPCMFSDEQRKVFVVFYVDDVQVLYYRDDQAYAQTIITGLN